MEIREITLSFKEGEITGIFLNSSLDHMYMKLFQNARRGAKRHPLDIEHGIKLVVFGCFFLEAKVNKEVRNILNHESDKEMYVSALWKSLKKRNFLEKIELLISVSPQKQQQKIILLRQKIKEVFDLRNRLAHFKDEPKQHAKRATRDDVHEFIDNLPIPELNQELMWDKTKIHAETISKTNKWLNNFRNITSTKQFKKT